MTGPVEEYFDGCSGSIEGRVRIEQAVVNFVRALERDANRAIRSKKERWQGINLVKLCVRTSVSSPWNRWVHRDDEVRIVQEKLDNKIRPAVRCDPAVSGV